jgi:UDP-glucose 4-epimerase
MSSVRAQAGAAADTPLSEADAPSPTDAYGRSKLAGEDAVRAAGVPYTVLRPVLVYGPGAKGNLASLMRLAALPLPLPLGALVNRRSLLALDNLISAVRFAVEDVRAVNETFLVADPGAISVAQLVSMLRTAFGRKPMLMRVPPRLLQLALTAAGRHDAYRRLAGPLIAEPSKLMAAGWKPVIDTQTAITQMVQAASPRKSGTASRSTP